MWIGKSSARNFGGMMKPIWIGCGENRPNFLVKDCVPVSCVAGIIVKTADREAYVKTILSRLSIEIPIYVDSKNNYFYP